MSTVRFNLRDKNTKGKTLVVLLYSFDSKRIRISTGISCYVKHWNFNKQRIYERFDIPYYREYNQHFTHLESTVYGLQHELNQAHKKVSESAFKQLLFQRLDNVNKPKKLLSFWNYFDQFVEVKKQEIKDIGDYHQALRKHLKVVETKQGQELSLTNLERKSDFLVAFDRYLRYEAKNRKGELGLSINTIGKQYKNLKVFLNWCFTEQIILPFSLKHLVTERIEVDSVYLTPEELDRLEKLELSGQLEICRDLFLVGCETGLRFSDFSDLQPSNVLGTHLEVRPKKTRKTTSKKLIIPISGRLRSILDKYNGKLPHWPLHGLHSFNESIRKCSEKAEINVNKVIEYRKRGQIHEISLPKWQLISSHTCRRTFCTLKFLQGMPAHVIMKFSGHSTEKNFLSYLKLDAEINADKYRNFFE
jgi:integrase